jgi:hypothetical protein
MFFNQPSPWFTSWAIAIAGQRPEIQDLEKIFVHIRQMEVPSVLPMGRH